MKCSKFPNKDCDLLTCNVQHKMCLWDKHPENEVPQPPPLTQGRMYVEVYKDAWEACERAFMYYGDRNNDGYIKNKFDYLQAIKPVPHTPAPAVSDDMPVKFAIWLRENHSTREKWDNVGLDADMWRNYDSDEEKSTEQLYKHWKENIYKAAATPAPIASDGEQQ